MQKRLSNGRRTSRLVSAALVGFVVIAAACGGGGGSSNNSDGGSNSGLPDDVTSDTTAPVPGGKIVVAVEAETSQPWTPADMQCASSCQMRIRTIFEPIISVGDDLQPHPWLAESVTPNADFTVWTIKVRSGIKFTDGTDLNADAVITNLNAGGKGFLLAPALVDLARGSDGNFVIEKKDDMTFTIATGINGDINNPKSWPGFAYALGTQWGMIASPTWLAAVKAGTAKADAPIGTGPFTLESFAPGDKMIVKKNPNYWQKDAEGNALPYLDEIEFRVIPDEKVAQQALESGEVNMIATSGANAIKPLSTQKDKFTYVAQDKYGEVNYILLHLSKPGPLQDQSVRCALTQAIDKVALIKAVASGFLDPATGMMSPGQEGYLDDNGGPKFDTAAAKAAIAAYEAKNGPVKINYSTTTAASSLLTAQYLQKIWGDIGVDVTVTQIEQSKLITNALTGDEAFEAFGWRNHAGLFVDQQTFWWASSAALPDGKLALNFGRLKDPVIDDLLSKARSEQDPAKRKGYAEDINRQFGKECWTIPTSFTKWGVFADKTIHGFGRMSTPDGKAKLRDGAGFPGQVFMTTLFVSK